MEGGGTTEYEAGISWQCMTRVETNLHEPKATQYLKRKTHTTVQKVLKHGAIAKWLRRQIRNLFSFGGAGSNPAGVALNNSV